MCIKAGMVHSDVFVDLGFVSGEPVEVSPGRGKRTVEHCEVQFGIQVECRLQQVDTTRTAQRNCVDSVAVFQ